jgi:hypothetical protein
VDARARDGSGRGRVLPVFVIGRRVSASEVVNTHVNIFTLILKIACLLGASKSYCVTFIYTIG